ncbi:hypothetical protein AAG747_03550 [Rapidithrix thailandica]|uniref:DUF2157 domain-containing protein n=1 Tax=Rapidithrix thailandica TaxID=413964 RepID=A0AAW9S5F6_9BACT
MKQKIDINSIIEFTHQKKEYSEIRKLLVDNGYSDQEIKQIMKVVDEEQMRIASNKQSAKNSLNLILMGALLFSIGFGVTVYTFLSGGSSFILAYGAIISGVALMIKGRANRKKQASERPPRIKRKSPYRK